MKKIFLLLFLLLNTTAFGLNPDIPISDFSQRLWTTNEGLPQNSILTILQTRDGYLWLGTQAGLVRFDGAQFHVFNTANSALRHNDVFSLAEDRNGNLWIGTFGGGISRYNNGKFKNFGARDGLTDEVVRSLFVDWQGTLWVGTRTGGIFKLGNNRFQQFSTANGLANNFVRSISEDNQGNLWIGTEKGLSRFKDGTFTTYTTKDGLTHNSIRWIFKDTLERLWLATDAGVTLLQNGKLSNPLADVSLSNESVRFVMEDRDRNIWVATDAGLNRIYKGTAISYTKVETLSNEPIIAIYEDREGNLWVGTDGGGLLQLKELKFRNFGGVNGMPEQTSYSVLEDRNGSLWVGTRASGLIHWNEEEKRTYSIKEGLLSNTVFGLYEDARGDIWVGTRGGGINLIRNGELTATTFRQELSNQTVRVILQTNDGSYWFGTNGGVNRWKDGKLDVFSTREGLAHEVVHSMLEDKDGKLWAGTFRGLSQWNGSRFTSDGIPEKLKSASIWAMHQDTSGDIWIGTYGSGLFHLNGSKATQISIDQGLFDNTILSLQEDNDGYFWMCTYHGIFRMRKKDLLEIVRGKATKAQYTLFDAADGMKSSEGIGGVQPSSWKTRNGRLLFLTVKGVTAIDPRNIRVNPLPPAVRLEQIVYDGTPNDIYEMPKEIVFPAGDGNLEIHYTALSFIVPEKVRFRYQLRGVDTDWVDASARRIAYYTHLPPGKYRFQVIASNNDGRWNETGVDFAFRIRPHFYQTYWFYGGMLFLVLGAIYSLHRLRILRLRKQFSAVLEERNRISREIHDTLTQDFTAVVLQLETAELTLNGDSQAVRDSLRRAQELARTGLAESRRFVRALRPAPLEHGDLVAALSVVTAQALGGSGLEYKMQVKGKKRVLSNDVEDNLLRITQEAVANVVKHAKARQVQVELNYKWNGVELRIRDDGRGIASEKTGRFEGGFGFISMRERAEQMRGKVRLHSVPGQPGTEIIVSVPRF